MICAVQERAARFYDRAKQCARYATEYEAHHAACGLGRVELNADNVFRATCRMLPGSPTWRGFCS